MATLEHCTRMPKEPPFEVGAKLRYLGTDTINVRVGSGPEVKLLYPGIVVVITRIDLGHRGTGRHLQDEDGPMYYATGEPMLDTTRDGYSVYQVRDSTGYRHPRAIVPAARKDWEIVELLRV